MEQKSKIVVGTHYKKANGRGKAKATSVDIIGTNKKVQRRYAEEINRRNEQDPEYLEEFLIDEEATAQWVIDNQKDYENRLEKAKIKELGNEDLASALIKMASKNLSSEEEKPKRTRRTKEQIEQEK